MNEKMIVGSIGGRKPSRMRNTLSMMMLLGALVDSPYCQDEIPKIKEKGRQLNCRTCIVKKDNPSYCKKCKEMED